VKIFISYSRIDASEYANIMHTYLKESGHEVFIDTSDIRGGEEWRNTIEKNISDCDIFVLIVSRSAYRRPEVKRELELADNMKKRIIPCINKKYVNYESLPDNIRKYNGINYERVDDLIQELDYIIELEKKDQGKTPSEVKTQASRQENYSPDLKRQSMANTTSVPVYLEKAKVFQRLKQYRIALKNYDKAIKLDPDNFDAHFNKTRFLYDIKDFNNALDTIEKAIDLQPENPDVWYHKGIILEKLERYEEAIEAFNTDLYFDDKDVKSWITKGNILLKIKRYDKALDAFDKILKLYPDNAEALTMKESLMQSYLSKDYTLLERRLLSKEKDYLANHWAIIIGISHYKDSTLNLNFAHQDAEDLYSILIESNGGSFKEDHIIKLINEDGTFRNIKTALGSFLKKPARDDVVLIYLSCKGGIDPDRPFNTYLLPYDTDVHNIAGTAVPMWELGNSILENVLSKNIVIIADSTISAAIDGDRVRPNITSTMINKYLQDLGKLQDGIAIFTSAEANETAFEDKRWGNGHGVFTYFLLEGLRGKADGYGGGKRDGVISIGELFEYVRDNVKESTDHKQHPSIGTSRYDRNLPLYDYLQLAV
jgi:tetratricopeptide (TPR) repeat protein